MVCAKGGIGGLQRAIEMITDAKKKKAGGKASATVVDLHPDRPDYRGMAIGQNIISLQADPTFEELEVAGGVVQKHADAHTVLDDFFFISGEIPRRTGYEHGLKGGMRYDAEEKDWFSDEGIADERFLMCRLKGMSVPLDRCAVADWFIQTKASSCSRRAVMPGWLTVRSMRRTR